MKKMFKFLLDSHIGAEGGFVQLHTDVNIAIFSLFAPCGGTEKSELLNTVCLCYTSSSYFFNSLILYHFPFSFNWFLLPSS